MSSFISPVSNEPITKLQYLLQNTLYTYAEIVSSLSPESSKELNDELSNVGIKSQVSDVHSNPNPDKDFKDDFILEKVERLGILNDQVQAHVDLLPDSSVSRDQILREISILNDESEKVTSELESLYKKYDMIYNTLKDTLN